MCYVVDDCYLSDMVEAAIKRLRGSKALTPEYKAMGVVLSVAARCQHNPSALEPLEEKHSYPGHPHTIKFRVYPINGFEAIFACPQPPLSFKVIYFGKELSDSVRRHRLFNDLYAYWST